METSRTSRFYRAKLTATTPLLSTARVNSIDLLRGVVMIIMVLDHVRDYFHYGAQYYDPLDLSQTTVITFLTRWITHFCAPIFVFLAGTSAWLSAQKKTKAELSRFLLIRGIWLILLEATIVSFGWQYHFPFTLVFQVIWAIGFSMMVLSVLIYLPKSLLLASSLLIIFGHNALDSFHVPGNSAGAFAWDALHDNHRFIFSWFTLQLKYPVLPWIGVMTAGYCFGSLYTSKNAEARKQILLRLGVSCLLLFMMLRFSNVYGDPDKWSMQKSGWFTVLSFINVTKYPPSLLYCLLTLGAAFLFLAFTEKPLNSFGKMLATYGRVPMGYYILHIYLIRMVSIIAGILSGFSIRQMSYFNPVHPLKGYGLPLWGTYLVWIAVVAVLYPFCKWYDGYKKKNKDKKWLSYL